jgi:plastocyanin domain-containing protein
MHRFRLTFTRTTNKTCATSVVLPSLNIRRDLPLNEPVDRRFTPAKTGEIRFVCGMNMLSGTIVIRQYGLARHATSGQSPGKASCQTGNCG